MFFGHQQICKFLCKELIGIIEEVFITVIMNTNSKPHFSLYFWKLSLLSNFLHLNLSRYIVVFVAKLAKIIDKILQLNKWSFNQNQFSLLYTLKNYQDHNHQFLQLIGLFVWGLYLPTQFHHQDHLSSWLVCKASTSKTSASTHLLRNN